MGQGNISENIIMRLNVTADMKNKVVKLPKSDGFLIDKSKLPDHIEDSEMIDYLSLDRQSISKIHKSATMARLEVLRSHKGTIEEAKFFAAQKFNSELKYGVVFHSLAVDNERCYEVNGEEQVSDYINEFFATVANAIYEDFAIEMINVNGLELLEEVIPFYDDQDDVIELVEDDNDNTGL